MRDIQQLLKEKEGSIEQLRREIEALRSVTPLLSDARPDIPQPSVCKGARTEASSQLGAALRAVGPLLVDETDEFDPEIRARLVEAAESDFKVSTAKRISRHLRHIAGPLLGSTVHSVSDCRIK